MSKYDFYCDFDVKKHKETYINYLEVLIKEDGEIVYAIPSHQEKAIALCCEKLQISRRELEAMCPREYYFDYLTWLLGICKAISVWDDRYFGEANEHQKKALKMLKLNGVYKGVIKQ